MTTISQHSGLDFGRAMGPALFDNDQSAEKGVTAKNSFSLCDQTPEVVVWKKLNTRRSGYINYSIVDLCMNQVKNEC